MGCQMVVAVAPPVAVQMSRAAALPGAPRDGRPALRALWAARHVRRT